MRVRCYVDGLNFYYGVSKKYKFKWINLEKLLLALLRQIVPDAEIEQVIIFTALVLPGQDMPKRDRQVKYLNALKAYSSRTKVVYGEFKKQEKDFEVVTKCALKGQTVRGSVNQEKQSDVNLACQVVRDAYEAHSEFDIACLVSGDMDLAYPLKLKAELGQRVILVIPQAEETETEANVRWVNKGLIEALINCGPDKYKFNELIAEASENLILKVPRELVLKHPLPDRVGPPPDAEGWSIQEARKAHAAELEAQARKRG